MTKRKNTLKSTSELTLKQKAFVDIYVSNWGEISKTEAATRAGYQSIKKEGPTEIASRLTNPIMMNNKRKLIISDKLPVRNMPNPWATLVTAMRMEYMDAAMRESDAFIDMAKMMVCWTPKERPSMATTGQAQLGLEMRAKAAFAMREVRSAAQMAFFLPRVSITRPPNIPPRIIPIPRTEETNPAAALLNCSGKRISRERLTTAFTPA